MYRERAKGWIKHLDFILLDLFCLEFSLVLAYWIRFGEFRLHADRLYRNMAFALLLIDVAAIFFGDVYNGVLRRGFFKEAVQCVYQAALIVGLSALYLFAVQEGGDYSRLALFYTGVIYGALTYVCRLLWKKAVGKIKRKTAYNALLVAAAPDRLEEALAGLESDARGGFHIAGAVVMDGGENASVDVLERKQYGSTPVVATESGLIDYVRREWVDEILFVAPETEARRKLLEELAESGIAVHESLGRAQSKVGRKQVVENLGGYTVMTTSVNYVTLRQAFFKRAMDIAGGLAGSLIALLALLIVGPLIYIKSPGPILFKQTRVGRNGRRFQFLKIRSMVVGADAMKKELMEQNRVKDGMMFKLEYDPRVIGCKRLEDGTIKKGVGNFIRDWSIDELPQFFNVLKGDMSLVGTRPPTVDEWEKYQLHHRARLAFRPGVTGLWQVSGRSNITDFEEVVRLDTKYINEWDFGLDCRIMAETVKAVLERTGSM